MKLVIDRFEGNYAICEKEDKTFINIEKDRLSNNVKENDVIYLDEETNEIKVLKEETEKKYEDVKKLVENLWK